MPSAVQTPHSTPHSPENDHSLRVLADQLPNGFVYRLARQRDGTERFTFLSAGVEHVLGLTRAQLYSDASTFFAAITPEDRAGLKAARNRAIESAGSLDYVYSTRHANGELR